MRRGGLAVPVLGVELEVDEGVAVVDFDVAADGGRDQQGTRDSYTARGARQEKKSAASFHRVVVQLSLAPPIKSTSPW